MGLGSWIKSKFSKGEPIEGTHAASKTVGTEEASFNYEETVPLRSKSEDVVGYPKENKGPNVFQRFGSAVGGTTSSAYNKAKNFVNKPKQPKMTAEEWQTYSASKYGLPEGEPPKTGRHAKGSRFWYEEAQRTKEREQKAKDETARVDELRRQEEASRKKTQKEYEEYKQRQTSGKPSAEDWLDKLSPKDRKKWEKKVKQGQEAEAKTRMEAAAEGIAPESIAYQKMYQEAHWVNDKGETVPKDTPGAHYMPGQWVLQEIRQKKSLAEIRMETAIQRETMSKLDDMRRERKLRPYKTAGKFMAETATTIGGIVALGAAGAARGANYGRGAMQTGAMMHTPVPRSGLYSPSPGRLSPLGPGFGSRFGGGRLRVKQSSDTPNLYRVRRLI